MIRFEHLARLAHQGGWDEVGLFAIPVVIALGAVWLVERSQRKRRASSPSSDDPTSEDEAEEG